MLLYFFKALLLGMIIALPFGPVGLLCLHRSVSGGVLLGLVSGLGAATADAFYGAIAAFGLKFLSDFLTSHHVVLQMVGGGFMLVLGIRFWMRSQGQDLSAVAGNVSQDAAVPAKHPGAFVSTFFLAAANPMTIVAFLAFFAGFGLGGLQAHYGHAAAVVLGVFCGSMIWWVAIAFGGGRMREKVVTRMGPLQRISGAVVGLFGIWALGEALVEAL